MSVVNFRVRKASSYREPVANGQELLFVTGTRSFKAQPLLSTDDPRCDKHKVERFLQAGQSSIATVYAPVAYKPLPLLAFKITDDGRARLALTGALHSCDPDRVVLHKIVLTGRATSVQKKSAIVSGMFRCPEDVRWFKPVELWTKWGRSGFIREPVGTHGDMKCQFEGTVQQRDTICMSLYKRVYPWWPQ